jgi:hypothetical protein
MITVIKLAVTGRGTRFCMKESVDLCIVVWTRRKCWPDWVYEATDRVVEIR